MNRQGFIGGSDVAPIMGLSPYRTAYDVWDEKKNGVSEDISGKPAVYWGTKLEHIILKEYQHENPNTIIDENPPEFTHPDYPWMVGHLDAHCPADEIVVEAKTSSVFRNKDWGPNGTDIIPVEYILQVHHYMIVTGYKEAHIPVLIGGSDFRTYVVRRDEPLCEKIMKALITFWNDYIEGDKTPEVVTRSDCDSRWPNDGGGVKKADPETLGLVDRISELKGSLKRYTVEKKELEVKLCRKIGESEGVSLHDSVIATWKSDKNGSRRLRINA